MFKNLKLGMKIGLGFSVILVLLSLVLTESILALNKADTGITQYRELARDTNLAGRLQANILMVRMNVKDYLITKSDHDLNQYRDYLAKVQDFLQEAKQEIHNPKRASLIAEIELELTDYQSSFATVIEFINRRNEVHDTRLVPSGEKMKSYIAEIILSAYEDGDSEAVYHASHVQDAMLLGRLYVVKYLQTNSRSDFDVAIENIQAGMKDELEDLDRNLQNSGRRQLLEEFIEAHRNYILAMSEINEAIQERNKVIEKKLDVIGPDIATNIENVKLSVMGDQDKLGPLLKSATSNSIKITLALSFAALIIGSIVAYFLTRTITRPIRDAVDAANLLSEGNLTINVGTPSKDETGLLLNAVQNTANNLKKMISTINSASDELASASEELSVVTEQTSKGILQQESETEMVATAMNQMSTTVHDVADNATEAADAAHKADEEAISGAQVVEKTIESIHLLSDSVNRSSERLHQVQLDVVNISSILDVIKGIADQTNLLALNAAIEAARAGEQGRGFAVVADEVRSLAAKTQESTSEIQVIIEQLQTGTENTVEAMNQGKVQAVDCVEQASGASLALGAITDAISVINDMNTQIASAAEQQSIVAESINQNVDNVKRIAQENTVASSQTRSSSVEIARLAEGLNQLVVQFKI